MPAALIPALIAAGGAVGGAAIAAHAAGEATDAQTNAANNALGLQQQQYNQTRTDYQPYRDLGVNALPQLAAMANAPVVQRGGPTGYFAGPHPELSPKYGGSPNGLGQPTFAAPPSAGMNLAALSSFAGGGDGTVLMEAPNGQRRPVPANQVAHYLAMGARRV